MTEERLGTESIGKLILSLGVPTMLAQLVNILYNIVDRIYIGHIPADGAMALTGLGVCTPIITLIGAFAAFAGTGGSPIASIALGEGNRERAERILGNAAAVILLFSTLITAGFLVFRRPILYAFGASDVTYPFAEQYLRIYLIGTVFVMSATGLNSFIVCQGQSRTAMLSVLIGAVSNILLDPLFIFVFRLGVFGAALATVISQLFSAVWVAAFLCSKRSRLRLRPAMLRPDGRILSQIASLGISPLTMQGTECLIATLFNVQLLRYGGDLYVGSMTILNSFIHLFSATIMGFTSGVMPLMSYNYGAGNFARVTETFRRMLVVTVSGTVAGCLVAVLFPGFAASLFTNDAELIAIVKRVFPVYVAAYWFFGTQMCIQHAFLALNVAKRSFFVAILRKIILLTPLMLILPRFMGVMGIFWAEPISDFLSAVGCILLFIPVYRKLRAGEPFRERGKDY